ncbi:MAG: hypothetical protein WJU30_00440 [Candidatus Phytoplasma pruni]
MLFDRKKKFNFLIKLEYLLLKGNKDFSFKNKKITREILFHIIAEIFDFRENYYWNNFIKTNKIRVVGFYYTRKIFFNMYRFRT